MTRSGCPGVSGCVVLLSTLVWSSLFAQTTDPKGRFGQPPPISQETVPLRPSVPLPPILPPVSPEAPLEEGRPEVRVFVRAFRLVGSTVFTPDELAEVVKPFVNRVLYTEDLDAVRLALTHQYVEHGYVNSGAVIPDQTVTDGVVTIQLIEGTLENIEVSGTKHFLSVYLTSRLSRSAGRPLNIQPLQERLQLFLQDTRFERINAELRPGPAAGEAVLQVEVQEASPYQAWLEFNNFQSPTVGAERGLATVAHLNPLGLGDYFRGTYGHSEGVEPLLDFQYSLPFTPWDTTFTGQYRRNDFTVTESPFDELDITSTSQIVTLSLRQPVYRTLMQEVALTLTGEYVENKNFLLGIPFSFTSGSTSRGEVRFSVLRFGQEWTYRQAHHVWSARSRFSFGLDVLNATTQGSSSVPDGQFFNWLGQVQVAHRFEPVGVQVIGRMDLQVSNDRLFPLEQYALGGRYTVRGYRENTIVRDNAFLFSVEGRVPFLASSTGDVLLQGAMFVDVGRGWNAKPPTPDPDTLASVGLGILTSLFHGNLQGSVYWGLPLNHVSTPNQNLQDHGLHVQLVWRVL